MGPIERELRGECERWALGEGKTLPWFWFAAMHVIRGVPGHAGRSTVQVFWDGDLPDVLSEAIEAAEALGL